VATHCKADIFVIDWNGGEESDLANSNWRRILVANQWNRLLTTRRHSVTFTLFVLVFFFEGLRWNLLATPMPAWSLIDIGVQYAILKLTIISVLWFILIGIQLLVVNFVVWKFFGDPFEGVVDTCKTTEVSLFVQTSLAHGHYINGHPGAQQPDAIVTRTSALKVGVYEAFFALDEREAFRDLYNNMLAQTGAPSVLSRRPHLAGNIPNTVSTACKQVNEFLREFFTRNSLFPFAVQTESRMQQLLGFPPTVIEDSVLTALSPSNYGYCFLSKLQWRLQFWYLVIIVSLEHATGSACIAAVIVYFLDAVLVKWAQMAGRANLADKSLLDDRLHL
jgi:meckelin